MFHNKAKWAAPAILVEILFFLGPFALVGYESARVAVLYLSGFGMTLDNMEIFAPLIDNRKLAGVLFLLMGGCGVGAAPYSS